MICEHNRPSCRVSFVIFVVHGGVTLLSVIAGEFFEWPYSFSSHVVRPALDNGGNYEMRHYGTDVSLPKPMASRQRSFFGWFLVPGWCSGLLGIGAWTMDPSTLHGEAGMLVRTAQNDAVYPWLKTPTPLVLGFGKIHLTPTTRRSTEGFLPIGCNSY